MTPKIAINTKNYKNSYVSRDIYSLLYDRVVKNDTHGYILRGWDIAELVRRICSYNSPKGINRASKKKRGEKIDLEWVKRFTEKFKDLKIDPSSCYITVRKETDDISSVKDFFNQIRKEIETCSIEQENIYCLSESSFQLDPIESITCDDSNLTIQFSEEYVTVFECISAQGNSIPPFMGPFDIQHPDIKSFPKGWKRDRIRLEWLTYFIDSTKGVNVRFLIVDEHKSRPNEEFKTLCQENNIILFFIPKDVWYHFINLDVAGSKDIKVFHRDRYKTVSSTTSLIEEYIKARSKSLIKTSIRRKFWITGITELDPEKLLKTLQSQKISINKEHTEENRHLVPTQTEEQGFKKANIKSPRKLTSLHSQTTTDSKTSTINSIVSSIRQRNIASTVISTQRPIRKKRMHQEEKRTKSRSLHPNLDKKAFYEREKRILQQCQSDKRHRLNSNSPSGSDDDYLKLSHRR